MNLRKIVKLVFSFFLFCLIAGKTVNAAENSFVTIVNPVRGDEFFDPKPTSFLDGFKIQKQLIANLNLPATWLLRFDILNSSLISNFMNFSDNQELGIFLEITPSLAKEALVSYPEKGIFWHDANKIFLSGFKPEDRVKLIDSAFKKFKDNFGYYPKSVGAWHIDAYSANYMKRKYGITGVLICADQFGTDNYQIWGGWWGVPYYPSRYNILMPAQTLKNKIDLVVFWWAARDPVLGYGGSVGESTYSVQVNDYQSHGLEIDYFKKLLDDYLNNKSNQFNQITIGLENDMDFDKFGKGFEEQLTEAARRKNIGEISLMTMTEFAGWYKKNFPLLSPDHQIDEWIMSKDFRVGFMEKENKKVIRDLRIYNENWPEANYLTANPWPSLSLNNPYKVDTVRFGDSAVNVDFEINVTSLLKKFGEQKIPFKVSTVILLSCYLATLLTAIFLIKNIPLLFLLFIGSIAISIPMVKSGLVYEYGMGFWGPNGHDGIWHIALIEQLSKFSFDNPVFSQTMLTNYHLGFDLMAAFLHLATRISVINLYFQILPPVMAVLIGILTYKLVEKWTGVRISAWWATFFVYFGGSWGWLLGKGESTFWANQSISVLINPPYALSLIVLLFGLIRFLDYLQKPSLRNLIICSLLFGILIQIKVYAGIIVLGSLGLCALYTNKRRELWKLFGLSLVISLAIFLPFNSKASSFLFFSPLWFSRTMLANSDRVGWFKLENARLAYLNSGKWMKWILAEGLALVIFIFGNLGTRAIGLFYGGFLCRRKNRLSEIEVFFIGLLTFSLIIPLLFIQKGTAWNTIQFFYYFQFIMAVIAGIFMGGLWENKRYIMFKYIVSATVVLLTLPTTFGTLKNNYLPKRPPARISIEELEGLNFLKKQPNGIVLSVSFNPDWRFKFSEPKPLYAYETTAYISALSGHQSFLEDEMNLEITGFDWKPRRDESVRFFVTADQKWGREFIIRNKIKYIYLVKGQKMNLGMGDINGKMIFENGEVVIYELI